MIHIKFFSLSSPFGIPVVLSWSEPLLFLPYPSYFHLFFPMFFLLGDFFDFMFKFLMSAIMFFACQKLLFF